MVGLGWLCFAIMAAYGCAIAAPLVRHGVRGRRGEFLAWCFAPLVLACPVIIPAEHVMLRALSAFVSGDIGFKMVDYFRQWGEIDPRIVLREYYRFLVPFPVLSTAYPDHKRRLNAQANRWRLLFITCAGVCGFVAAVVTVQSMSTNEQLRGNFALNHVVMLLIFVVAIESLSRALYGIERLAGYDTTPIIQNAYLARTVFGFWQRYNRRIHDWLYRNVFEPSGGRRSPARSVLLVFFVSGLFHEVMFSIATSQITGYQLAFFTIQGPAALATARIERLARRRGKWLSIATRIATIVFISLSSLLFFHGVHQVFPFIYASRSPLPW
jgi:hypothetical protein